jgi:hypothetical protein
MRWCILLLCVNLGAQVVALLAYVVLTCELVLPPDRPWDAWMRLPRTEKG